MSNPSVTCPSPHELQGLLDGSLPESKTNELAVHLEVCSECRGSLDRLAAGDDWPEQVAKHLSRPGGESLTAARIAQRWRKPPASDTASISDGLERLEFLEPASEPGVLGMLGPYEITETIGRGGFGLVLKGRDPRLNRIVAVKVLAPEWASNAMARKRFLREAQAAAAVRHDHVVTIYAVDEVAKLPYLVMEYVPGKSLQQRLDEQGPLEVREILRIGRQIALGLSAAHAEGLIHRDIKPGNVLLEDGIQRVKITDFGLARAVDDVGMTQTGTVAGTPEYMSPEQAWGGAVDHRTDLFSLGGVLYAMCTGRSPFRAKSVLAVLKRVSEDEPRPIEEVNPEIPYGLIGLIEQLLAKNPQQRIASAEEVADLLGAQLAALQNADTVHMPAEPRLEYAPRGEVPPDSWSWIAGCFHRANGWGRGLWPSLYGRKAVPASQTERRVRWPLMFLIGLFTFFLLPIVMYLLLNSLEGRHRFVSRPSTRPPVASASSTYPTRPPRPWSPPLITTNELTLDILSPELQIAIDGRAYPVEGAGQRLVRLGHGPHTIAVADNERGQFDQVEFSTPTSESYLRIDRGGIQQSTAPTNVQVKWLPADAAVSSLRFQGKKDRLLGLDASSGGQVRFWNIGGGRETPASVGDHGHIGSTVMEPYPGEGMGGSMDVGSSMNLKAARAWDVSQDGNFLSIGWGEQKREVRLFNIAADDPYMHREMTVTQHPAAIQEIAFSPNGRLLLCTSGDRTEVFRMDDLIATKLGEISRVPGRGSISSGVVQAKFLPDNRRVLISDKNGNIEIWNTRPLRLETAFTGSRIGAGPPRSIDIDPTGRRAILNGADRLCFFDLEQAKILSKPDWPGDKSLMLSDACLLPDGQHALLAVHDQPGNSQNVQRPARGESFNSALNQKSGSHTAQLWIGHIETGRIMARLDFVESLRISTSRLQCHDLRFSPDGRRITSACLVIGDGYSAVAVVDWAVPEEAFAAEIEPKTASIQHRIDLVQNLKTDGEVTSVALTPDGKQFVTGDANGSILWTFPDGQPVHRLQAGDSQVGNRSEPQLAVSPDGEMIAESRGNLLRLWSRETGEQQASTKLSDVFGPMDRRIDRIQQIRSLAWSADGRHLLIACPRPTFQEGDQARSMSPAFAFLVKIEGDEAKILKRFPHPHDVNAAMFLDENRIGTACADGRVRIWDVDSQKTLSELRTGDQAVLCLDATMDGAYLAAGSADGSWHLWETRYGVRLNHWSEESAINSLRFLPQEDRLVTAHDDGQLVLWNLLDMSELTRTRGNQSLTAFAIAPDGGHLLSASKGQPAVQVWKMIYGK